LEWIESLQTGSKLATFKFAGLRPRALPEQPTGIMTYLQIAVATVYQSG